MHHDGRLSTFNEHGQSCLIQRPVGKDVNHCLVVGVVLGEPFDILEQVRCTMAMVRRGDGSGYSSSRSFHVYAASSFHPLLISR
jgi:hypothetical protein